MERGENADCKPQQNQKMLLEFGEDNPIVTLLHISLVYKTSIQFK